MRWEFPRRRSSVSYGWRAPGFSMSWAARKLRLRQTDPLLSWNRSLFPAAPAMGDLLLHLGDLRFRRAGQLSVTLQFLESGERTGQIGCGRLELLQFDFRLPATLQGFGPI